MILGIVGHEALKFTPATEALARAAIYEEILARGATMIVSGHCHLGGVDIYAEEIAALMGLPTRIFAPKQLWWNGPYGFKARNLDIANFSDLVLCVVVREYHPGYEGLRFEGCYHCLSRTPPHVKSGGCWTAWKAKAQAWRIIEQAA